MHYLYIAHIVKRLDYTRYTYNNNIKAKTKLTKQNEKSVMIKAKFPPSYDFPTHPPNGCQFIWWQSLFNFEKEIIHTFIYKLYL